MFENYRIIQDAATSEASTAWSVRPCQQPRPDTEQE